MCLIPSSMSEYKSIDNLPTGSVRLLMRRYEMPEKICVERYWDGMEKPEQLAYIPARTATRVKVPLKGHTSIGHYECGGCHGVVGAQDAYCKHCGARLVEP